MFKSGMSRKNAKGEKNARGDEFWHNEFGVFHREDGPAITEANGDLRWFINGILHREDGPAVIRKEYQSWYINGRLHREDGPADESTNGRNAWYIQGLLHREDGPAFEPGCTAHEHSDIKEEYWLFGEKIPKKKFTKKLIRQMKMIRIIET